MTLRLMIVDDEPLARLRLRTLLQDLQTAADLSDAAAAASGAASGAAARWTVAAEAANADEALLQLRRQSADAPLHALLLDVRLPGRSGLQLAHALRTMPQPPAVVFVTAHAEHALTAFELDAVDYLTKPVRRERLAQALQRVQQRLPLQTQTATPAASPAAPLPNPAVASMAPTYAAAGVLLIHERDRVLRLPVAELLYFRADQKQVLLRTVGSSLLIDDSLSELEDKLTALGGRFIRVHRNALVALGAMRELALRTTLPREQTEGGDGWAVRVAPLDEWLSVSRRQVAAVKAALAGSAP